MSDQLGRFRQLRLARFLSDQRGNRLASPVVRSYLLKVSGGRTRQASRYAPPPRSPRSARWPWRRGARCVPNNAVWARRSGA